VPCEFDFASGKFKPEVKFGGASNFAFYTNLSGFGLGAVA